VTPVPPATEDPSHSRPSNNSPFGIKRILVVDDEPSIRELLCEFLGMEGYVVQTAVHGREALDHARNKRPNLVLLDLHMPEMDGRQFSQACRTDPGLAGLAIVLMTAAPDAESVCAEIGARACLRKPFELDTLAQVLERVS
jgi:CheY-like chemotaxis protein